MNQLVLQQCSDEIGSENSLVGGSIRASLKCSSTADLCSTCEQRNVQNWSKYWQNRSYAQTQNPKTLQISYGELRASGGSLVTEENQTIHPRSFNFKLSVLHSNDCLSIKELVCFWSRSSAPHYIPGFKKATNRLLHWKPLFTAVSLTLDCYPRWKKTVSGASSLYSFAQLN